MLIVHETDRFVGSRSKLLKHLTIQAHHPHPGISRFKLSSPNHLLCHCCSVHSWLIRLPATTRARPPSLMLSVISCMALCSLIREPLSLSHPPNELRGVRPLSICPSVLVSTADWCTSARDGGWGARVVLGQLLGSLAFKVRNSTVTLIYGSALANVFLWSVKIFALASNVHSNCSLSMQQVVHYVMLTTVKLHMARLCSAQLSTPAHALY